MGLTIEELVMVFVAIVTLIVLAGAIWSEAHRHLRAIAQDRLADRQFDLGAGNRK